MAPFILHIDDHLELPAGVAESLDEDGYQFHWTSDPEEAMRLVEERSPALVVMEVELAGCEGIDLLAGIRDSQFGEVPVLVLTHGPRDSGIHGEAIALGILDFLEKPVSAGELLQAIHETAPPPEQVAQEAAPVVPDLSGDLSETPMPELLARLRRRGESGVLIAGHAGIRVGVQLRNGSPVGVSSSRREPVAEALLYETFGWEEGRFAFSEGRRLESDVVLELKGDPAGLLLAGALDAFPAHLVHDRLAKRESLYVSFTEESESALTTEGVAFTRQQRDLVESLGGADTFSVLIESPVFDEHLVYALWVGGWLELRTSPTLTLTELLGDPAELELELEEFETEQEQFEPEVEEFEPLGEDEQELEVLRLRREEREQELEELARTRVEREQELEELARAREERILELQELARAREQRAGELEDLERAGAQRAQRLEELGRSRAARDQELEELARAREERAREEHSQELEELALVREERAREQEEFANAREQRVRELEDLERARDERARELEELTRAREQRAQELEAFGRSSVESEPEAGDLHLGLDAPAPAPKKPEPGRLKPASKRASPARAKVSHKSVTLAASEPAAKHGEPALPTAPPAAKGRDAPSGSLRELAERVLAGDDFQALGITPSASDDDVRAAYEGILRDVPEVEFTAANLVHAQRTQRIRNRVKAAFVNLCDAEKRRSYELIHEEELQDRKAKPSAERALEGERWFREGKAHLELQRCAKALEAFGMASQLDPEQGEYASHLGYALYLSNPDDEVMRAEATEHIARGIKLSPESELSYVFLGRIYKAKGDINVARKIFSKALRIKPDFRPAVQELRSLKKPKLKGVLSRLIKR